MRISKNILFRTVPFDASDCHALELYLSEMAAKGWMLDEIWILNIFKFKRCEPKNMRFTVDIPKLSDTCADTSLQNYELLFNEYIDICESSGWKHIVESSQYQIFCTEDVNAVDIQTDDSLKLDSLLKFNFGYFIQMLCFIFLALTFGKNNPTIESYSYGKLCMTIFYSSITFFFGLNFLEDLLWKLNAKKSLKEGNIVKYPGLSSFKIKLLIQKYNSVAIIILLVGIFILQNENQIIYLILAFSIGFIILTIMLLVNIIKNHS
mgnify:CR=1 FL=1